MNIHLITESSPWFILLCLVLGVMYALVLYRSSHLLKEVAYWLKVVLFFLRFVVVFFLAFLLLNPLIKTLFRETENPILILAMDNSESLLIGKDSSDNKLKYKKETEQLIEQLSKQYVVKTYSFGETIEEGINYSFDEKQTDIANVLDELNTLYTNRNVGAIIIASDGLYNQGLNPMYASNKIKAPIYTLALGDTTLKKDILISHVRYNRLAYLGNRFPIEVLLTAKQSKGEEVQLSVSKGNHTLFMQKVSIDREDFIQTIPIQIEATATGIQKYTVRVANVKEEVSDANNVLSVFIDVLDGRQKVLLLADAPHPDVAVLKQGIENNERYEVQVALARDFNKNLEEYNLIVLHQIPSKEQSYANLINFLTKSNVPVLFILGNSSALAQFNAMQSVLKITEDNKKMNEVQAAVSEDFVVFTLSDALRNAIGKFPPLLSPFGNYTFISSSSVLLNQKIGVVTTKQPLLLFNAGNNKKIGVLTGEGIWRWKLNDFAEHGNHEIVNELVSKTVQYLATKEDKSQFRIITKNHFLENEPITFDAELYNDNYELVNFSDIHLDLIDSEEKRFSYTFSKTTDAYHLTAGIFPVGEYRYEAKSKIGEKIVTENGELSVNAIQVEQLATTANHQLLYQLAKKNDGKMFTLSEIEQLYQEIENRKDIQTVFYTKKELKELVYMKWVFFLLMLLLAIEWFLRKRSGAY